MIKSQCLRSFQDCSGDCMVVYLYDGSFEGMLTCVYQGYYLKEELVGIYNTYQYKQDLFHQAKFIITDPEKAEKVAMAIISKLSEDFFHKILNAFFSEDYHVAFDIYQLLRYGFKSGGEIIKNEAHDLVSKVTKLSTAVGRETHLFVGLVRFVKLKGDIYYCQFSPTYNQVALLAEHFANRFSDQLWVIHDLSRNIAVFYDKNEWYVNEFYGLDNYHLDDEELLYQDLWKTFYKHIAIKERENPKLRRSFMPKKYWKYLIEMNQ